MSIPYTTETIPVSIVSIAFGGYGIAHHEGKTIFVSRAFPGEDILARIYSKKKGVFFADCVEVIKPSPARRSPPCPAFGACGGCALQDINYETQFELKCRSLLDSLRHIGNLTDIPEPVQIPADREFRYRNKMEFGFGSDGDAVFMGLHRRESFDKIVKTSDCLIMPESGNIILKAIENKVNKINARIYNKRDDTGLLRYLTLRFSETNGDYLASVTVKQPEREVVSNILEAARNAAPQISGGSMTVNSGTGDTAGGELEPFFGKGFIEEEIDGLIFRISPKSFFQTNTRMARKFYKVISEYSGDSGGTALDLFCGTGTITQLIAKKFSSVIGMEISASAVDDARESASRNGIKNVEFICGSVEKNLDAVLEKNAPDVLVLDPPRCGAARKTIEKTNEIAPPIIVYASCNPTTLARDISLLSGKYRVEKIAFVDMFPQTFHIESVAKLVLK
jgi:23S rRNA (uracil1939-C5)-methyltransferase